MQRRLTKREQKRFEKLMEETWAGQFRKLWEALRELGLALVKLVKRKPRR